MKHFELENVMTPEALYIWTVFLVFLECVCFVLSKNLHPVAFIPLLSSPCHTQPWDTCIEIHKSCQTRDLALVAKVRLMEMLDLHPVQHSILRGKTLGGGAHSVRTADQEIIVGSATQGPG